MNVAPARQLAAARKHLAGGYRRALAGSACASRSADASARGHFRIHTLGLDWDIGFALSYKNFAALDGLAQKVLDLRMK